MGAQFFDCTHADSSLATPERCYSCAPLTFASMRLLQRNRDVYTKSKHGGALNHSSVA
jgi:hypothetical protein